MATPRLDDDESVVNFTDYRDIVIADLSDENALLREYIESLQADVCAYRELAQQALHRLHDQQEEFRRRDDQHRHLREQVMRDAVMRQSAA